MTKAKNQEPVIEPDFLERCALVSVDFQECDRPEPARTEDLPSDWRKVGFTAQDVNTATTLAWEVALPNAVRVLAACRRFHLPCIFLHWGYRFKDGMDLDPVIRSAMLRNHGSDYEQWHGYIGHRHSLPPRRFRIRPSEYVIAKTAQDAFISSPLGFVLANLGVVHLIMMGGHTEACLGKTAMSAKQRGFRTLCVVDATTNARESTRPRGIADGQYDYHLTTNELVALLKARAAR